MTNSWNRSRQRKTMAVLLILGPGMLLAYLVLGSVAPAAPEDKKEKGVVDRLTIELRLSKEEYTVAESVDGEVVFRNNGKDDLKVPLIEGEEKMLFFDFLMLGDMGKGHLTRHGDGWSDPSVKPVKLVLLRPGATHTVKLKNLLSLQAFDAGVHEKEQYKLVAIYRDHSYGHSPTYPEYGKQDPSVWKGIAISTPVVIKRITLKP